MNMILEAVCWHLGTGGDQMVDVIFDQCVLLLIFLAERLGMTYKAINVWIFVVIWPVLTLALIAVVILQQLKIRKILGQASGPSDRKMTQ
jgi:hypothetical protein